jgi:hypothetical protein
MAPATPAAGSDRTTRSARSRRHGMRTYLPTRAAGPRASACCGPPRSVAGSGDRCLGKTALCAAISATKVCSRLPGARSVRLGRCGHLQGMGTGRHPVPGGCAAVDVPYLRSDGARAAAAVAADAAFSQVLAGRTAVVPEVPPYRPGEFCRRELPPLHAVLDGIGGLRLLVVDGYADLDPGGRPGLAPTRTPSSVSRWSAWPSRRSGLLSTPSRCCGGPPPARCLSLPPGCLAPTRRSWCGSWLAGSGYPTRCAARTSSPAPARRQLSTEATTTADTHAERGISADRVWPARFRQRHSGHRRCGLPGWWCGGVEQPDPAAPRRPGPKPPVLPGCAGLGGLPGVRRAGRSGGGLLSRLRVSGSLRALGQRCWALDDDLAPGAGC